MSEDSQAHWRTVNIIGATLDTVGLVGCLYMLTSICAYGSYRTTKDRIILMLCLVTIAFVALGNLPEKSHILMDGIESPIPEWNIFMVYSTWWAVLMTEALLLYYSYYILCAITPGATLRTAVVDWKSEMKLLAVLFIIACTAGALSLHTLTLACGDGDAGVYMINTNDRCNNAVSTITWIWIGFLIVPFAIQFAIWSKVLKATEKIQRFREASENGETVLDASVIVAPALDRIIKSVVKPLQWYPLVFLMLAALYFVWVISLYSSQRTENWARQMGPASSLVFAVKGIVNSSVYILSQDHARRERGLIEQIRLRLRSTESWNGSSAQENLVQEFSQNTSGQLTSTSDLTLTYEYDQYAGAKPLSNTLDSSMSRSQ